MQYKFFFAIVVCFVFSEGKGHLQTSVKVLLKFLLLYDYELRLTKEMMYYTKLVQTFLTGVSFPNL